MRYLREPGCPPPKQMEEDKPKLRIYNPQEKRPVVRNMGGELCIRAGKVWIPRKLLCNVEETN